MLFILTCIPYIWICSLIHFAYHIKKLCSFQRTEYPETRKQRKILQSYKLYLSRFYAHKSLLLLLNESVLPSETDPKRKTLPLKLSKCNGTWKTTKGAYFQNHKWFSNNVLLPDSYLSIWKLLAQALCLISGFIQRNRISVKVTSTDFIGSVLSFCQNTIHNHD